MWLLPLTLPVPLLEGALWLYQHHRPPWPEIHNNLLISRSLIASAKSPLPCKVNGHRFLGLGQGHLQRPLLTFHYLVFLERHSAILEEESLLSNLIMLISEMWTGITQLSIISPCHSGKSTLLCPLVLDLTCVCFTQWKVSRSDFSRSLKYT
jgi:hypothetical protein